MEKITESRQYETIKIIFLKSMSELFPNYDVELQNSLNNGSYGEVFDKNEIVELSNEDYEKVKEQMRKTITENLPITLATDDIELMKENWRKIERDDIRELLKNCGWAKIKAFQVGGYTDYFYLEPEKLTGLVKDFDLYKYDRGFILKTPMEVFDWNVAPMKDTPKIAQAFQEGNDWERIMGINFAGSLNKKVFKREIAELIMLNETFILRKLINLQMKL